MRVMNNKLSGLVTGCVILAVLGLCATISLPSLLRARMGGSAPGWQAPVFVARGDWHPTAIDRENTERYARVDENPFRSVVDEPLSTFSIDVDTASYANVRRFLDRGRLPPIDAVRTEELVNYFRFDYPEPGPDTPLSVTTEVGECPWNSESRLLLIGLKGRDLKQDALPPRNLVFLIDVSGSMDAPDKLPLLIKAMNLLVDRLTERDRVSIVVYAGAAGLALPPTPGSEKAAIREALANLSAGGSTAGGEGILLAYRQAERSYLHDGINRVILATDGDFNVGISSDATLTRLIEDKRRSGVFLSVLGFGEGNLNDSAMEKMADMGNGNYSYIDSIAEARKVLVKEAGATLVTLARDVKIQVEFNPALVAEYRLIGYENRLLSAQDFGDDSKDAGEIGAGHTVTALYEWTPAGGVERPRRMDPLKYQVARVARPDAASGELATVKLRYQPAAGGPSALMTVAVSPSTSATGANLTWASSVAGFALLLRDSEYKGRASFAMVDELARDAIGADPEGYRREFVGLVAKARDLAR